MTPSLWLGDAPLILASGSATRRDMLVAAGIPVAIVKPEVDERAVEGPLQEQGATGPEIAAALASAKALSVAALRPGRVVLGADQTLTCDNTSFHKPTDEAAARAQIAALCGREHQLHSAFALARDGAILSEGVQTARLSMRALNRAFIATYVAQAGEGARTSVGAYQIEGLGAQLFDRIEGDHFTILGLPLLAVLAGLRRHSLLLN